MSEAGELYDTLMCGLVGGVAISCALAFWRSRAPSHIRIAFVLLFLSAFAWTVMGSPLQILIADQSALVVLLVMPFGGAAPAFFWLTIRTLFEDRPIGRLGLVPAIVQMSLMAAILIFESTGFWAGGWKVMTLLSLTLAGHGLFMMVRGWRGDLVEGRRRLRTLFLVLFGLASLQLIAMLSADFVLSAGYGGPWMFHALYTTLALLAAATALMLDVRRTLFAPTPVRTGKDGSAEDRAALKALGRLMTEDEMWRREGLSIGDLAAEMGLPEHRLRRLINGHLGHRNFAAFVNAYRIEAAMAQLADPAQARKTVAEIAFNHGFTSLNPFNRAFKDITGETPTAWRRGRMLVENGNPPRPSKTDETPGAGSAKAGRGTSEHRIH